MERTEEDKLLRASITVILGGLQYDIAPLVIKDARAWRKKLSALISKLPAYTKVTTDSPQAFENAVNLMLVAMPDEMASLFFAYAKDLNRDEIEATATEAELGNALGEVIKVSFPLLASLTGALKNMAR